MLFFSIAICLIIILFIVAIIVILSNINIKVNKLHINSLTKQENNNELSVEISLKLWKIKLFKIKLNKGKIAGIFVKIKQKVDNKNIGIEEIEKQIKDEIEINKKIKTKLKKQSIELQSIKADISLGTEDVIITSYTVAFMSIIISNILPHITNKSNEEIKNIEYKIAPIYANKNMYIIKLSCEISVKILYILIMFCMYKKEKARK